MTRLHRSLVAVVAALTLLAVVGPRVGASPPTADPPTAAAYGADWLEDRIGAGGFVDAGGGVPDAGSTGTVALALAMSGAGGDDFDLAMTWLTANVDAFVAPFAIDDAGRLGILLMLVDAAGLDPHDVGPSHIDLVARLEATQGLFEAGLYGAGDPTYDGAFRQGLAILGLDAAGVVPTAGLGWLRDQQCDTANLTSEGAWISYRPDTAVACIDPDPIFFAGPDTNSTAMALIALAAAESTPDFDGLGWLAALQETTGGWSFIPGTGTDPNSTALVINAILATGGNPATWTEAANTPWSSLLSWQIGCEAPADQRGAFASPFSGGAPDLFASVQAIPAVGGGTYEFDAPVDLLADAPDVDCSAPTTTTTTTSTTAPTSSTTSTTSTSTSTTVASVRPETVRAVAATPIFTTPTFAG